MPVQGPPDLSGGELALLLDEPLARMLMAPATSGALSDDAAAVPGIRRRLADRMAASREASLRMVTVRRRQQSGQTLAPGVMGELLYRAPQPAALRAGEPLLAMLVKLAPGAALEARTLQALWPHEVPAHTEWLLMAGQAIVAGERISMRDYMVVPALALADGGGPACTSEQGALLFMRASPAAGHEALDHPLTVRDADAGWPDFAPGIQRRVLWQSGGQAALLYYAQPGAAVPSHVHGHDEECLMVQGELFLDDQLLQAGDYQLAPAGTGHQITATDTGVVIYAHGDLDLRFEG